MVDGCHLARPTRQGSKTPVGALRTLTDVAHTRRKDWIESRSWTGGLDCHCAHFTTPTFPHKNTGRRSSCRCLKPRTLLRIVSDATRPLRSLSPAPWAKPHTGPTTLLRWLVRRLSRFGGIATANLVHQYRPVILQEFFNFLESGDPPRHRSLLWLLEQLVVNQPFADTQDAQLAILELPELPILQSVPAIVFCEFHSFV